jgi:hypothetical protein
VIPIAGRRSHIWIVQTLHVRELGAGVHSGSVDRPRVLFSVSANPAVSPRCGTLDVHTSPSGVFLLAVW